MYRWGIDEVTAGDRNSDVDGVLRISGHGDELMMVMTIGGGWTWFSGRERQPRDEEWTEKGYRWWQSWGDLTCRLLQPSNGMQDAASGGAVAWFVACADEASQSLSIT